MKIERLGAAIAIAFSVASAPAIAATLSVNGGAAATLGANFSLSDDPAYAALSGGVGDPGDAITTFAPTAAGVGLSVDQPVRVSLTYLGFEAGALNTAVFDGADIFDTATSVVGDTMSGATADAGLLRFLVNNLNRGVLASVENGGVADTGLKLAFSAPFNGGSSVLVFFDGANPDVDFDDVGFRIDVVAIPVPASGLLFVTALAGIAFVQRRGAARA